MTIDTAVSWCNAQIGQSLDFDGMYGVQCFDFFNFYYQFITGRNPYTDGYSSADGVDYARQIIDVSNPLFTIVRNNPNDPNQLPVQSSIMILNQNIGGGAGHVQVYDTGDTTGYWCWEQNWGGPYVEHRYHTWASLNGLISGWMIYNVFNSGSLPQGGDVAIIQDNDNWRRRAQRSFQTIRGRSMGDDEFKPFIGQDFLNLIEALEDNPDADVNIRNATVGNQAITDGWQQQIYSLQDALQKAQDAATAAANDDNASKAQLKAALQKVSDLTDQVKKLQIPTSSSPASSPPVKDQPDAPSVDVTTTVKNLWANIKKYLHIK